MVAVTLEPCSAFEILGYRVFTGKSERFSALGTNSALNSRHISTCCLRFPCALEQGIYSSEQGSCLTRTGSRAGETGTAANPTRVSRITLGQAGRGQLEAMNEDATESRDKRGNKRTHWVRGHPMRNRSGGISWRMPHLRGAGPLNSQRREVTAARSLPEDFGHDDGY